MIKNVIIGIAISILAAFVLKSCVKDSEGPTLENYFYLSNGSGNPDEGFYKVTSAQWKPSTSAFLVRTKDGPALSMRFREKPQPGRYLAGDAILPLDSNRCSFSIDLIYGSVFQRTPQESIIDVKKQGEIYIIDFANVEMTGGYRLSGNFRSK